MHCSPSANNSALEKFDDHLRLTVTSITNSALSDAQWLQASMPIKHGGLGIRRVTSLAAPAFLASAAKQEQILAQFPCPTDSFLDSYLSSIAVENLGAFSLSTLVPEWSQSQAQQFLWWGASVIILVPTSVGVAAAFQLCSTARHFRDQRRSGPIVTPALILTFLLLTLGNYTPKSIIIKNNNNNNNNNRGELLVSVCVLVSRRRSVSRLG